MYNCIARHQADISGITASALHGMIAEGLGGYIGDIFQLIKAFWVADECHLREGKRRYLIPANAAISLQSGRGISHQRGFSYLKNGAGRELFFNTPLYYVNIYVSCERSSREIYFRSHASVENNRNGNICFWLSVLTCRPFISCCENIVMEMGNLISASAYLFYGINGIIRNYQRTAFRRQALK